MPTSKLYIACVALVCAVLFGGRANAQTATLSGRLQLPYATPVEFTLVVVPELQRSAEVGTDGRFTFNEIPYGTYTLQLKSMRFFAEDRSISVQSPTVKLALPVQLTTTVELGQAEVATELEAQFGIAYIERFREFTLYEAKKHEVILLPNLTANTATNNPRQIFGGITGLNIWESDGAGLQLGIGGRGLNPNRTSNFNTRQNGYDISADALGYPESYYTPPAEVLERIEVIRGAASLQYGTQFGGMINFVFREAETQKPFAYTGRHSYGSWNFINSFNLFSGTLAKGKLNYFAYYQRKQGDGWRPNSEFALNSGFVRLGYTPNKRHNLKLEFTRMHYLAQQPGGLTDAQFAIDPLISNRSRNWFDVDWTLIALDYTHTFNSTSKANLKAFALDASRKAVGNLERINVLDFNGNRTLIEGNFNNVAVELRYLKEFELLKLNHALVTGVRLYRGHTEALQGDADNGDGPSFEFLNRHRLEGSDYTFPNLNYAWFLENVISLSERWSITPGLRFEHIETRAEGYYRQRVFDFAGNVIADQSINEQLERNRSFLIAGIGSQFKINDRLSLYANASQNYRAINFSDLRIANPNFRIDPELSDERGYTADLGFRGRIDQILRFEVTAFYLYYNNRIGQILQADVPPLYIDYRFRTNVSASRTLGIEAYAALNLKRWLLSTRDKWLLTAFVNTAYIDARYVNSRNNGIDGNKVEMVPDLIVRSGITAGYDKFTASFQFNYTSEHFSDASNAVRTATAVEGLIPAYSVSDVSAKYRFSEHIQVEASCNNLFNAMYFTRRAEAYPGPGLLPADGRSFYITLQVQL
ncbi:MAG: TonB-dependent receptor domain-containing protein [Flavobacteriales bacterium]